MDLVCYKSHREVIAKLPNISQQIDYQLKLSALKSYVKDANLSASDLWAQVAIAKTLPKALKNGDISAAGSRYRVSQCETEISGNTITRMRELAKIPEARLREYIENVNTPSRNGAMQWWCVKQKSEANLKFTSPVCVNEFSSLNGQKFGTIYADPPWQYGNQSTRASTDSHYGTMPLEEICDLPVESITADDAHLHLWTTNAFLFDAKQVMEAWGFEYRSCFVWVKPQIGIGNYWRVSHEFLLLGIRGDAKRFNDKSLRSWGEFDRTRHSAKPEKIREYIELASPGPYLEMFGRSEMSGWTVFGNQIERKLFT